MASITIHQIDGELDQRLTAEAKRRKTSKNSLIKELLARALGLPIKGKLSDDYSEFCGLWAAEEQAEFEAVRAENSKVDPEDWK
jgi:predicted HicB family RNase H-like nuclease